MGTDLLWKVKEGASINLKDFDPSYVEKGIERAVADSELLKLGDELNELQELFAAAQLVSG